MSRAFISYSRRNTNFAERLARDLTDAGVEVWIDFRQIHAGERWKDEIRRGIERSDVVIILLSPDSVVSEWVQFEVLYGREQGKMVLPVMAIESSHLLRDSDTLRWLLDVHYIMFENRYEQAFPELLKALPGKRRLGSFDLIDPVQIPNPFKGLEAFQQTDAAFFFGREQLVKKALSALRPGRERRFLAVVGASGSGKSSLVRAGVIPQVRSGALQGSAAWRVAIFTPGDQPVKALATRLAPLLPDEIDAEAVQTALRSGPNGLTRVAARLMSDTPANALFLLVVDQFEETFTRASEASAAEFIALLHDAATAAGGRCIVAMTMRADFFDRLGKYPAFAELFEADQLLIVTEMTPSNLLRAITGPADAVGLLYDDGLADRILEDVRRQPGSLPLLQYALTELYQRRDGRRLTHAAYDAIGGVEQALARHAEEIYLRLGIGQQDTMRRILLRLIEVAEDGTATRRKVARDELSFVGISAQAVQEIIDRLTAADSRLLVTSREIRTSVNQTASATVWVEVGHEALIREWTRFQDWIDADLENLRLGADVLKSAGDWLAANRDTAYLLTGTRLARAEEWLDNADASLLQREFIRASVDERERREALEREQSERELVLQRRSANRLRAFVAVLAGALMLTAGLVLFAFSERDRAESNARLAATNQAAAEQNAALAQQNLARSNSFALAALADRALSDGDSELAVALAVQANLITTSPPPQSSLTLAAVAFAPGTRQNFEPSSASVAALALSRDETVLLAAETTGVFLYDARTGELLREIGEGLTTATAVDISPDGETALVGMANGTIVAYSTADGQQLAVWKSEVGTAINSLTYNSSGSRAVSTDASRVVVYDASGQEVRRFAAQRAVARFWPLDEDIVITADRTNLLVAWNVPRGISVKRWRLELTPLALALSPDGQFALVGSAGIGDDAPAAVRLYALGSIDRSAEPAVGTPDTVAQPVRAFVGHSAPSESHGVGFGLDGARVLSIADDGQLIVWETATGDVTTSFTVTGDSNLLALTISSDGEQAVVAGETDGVGVLRMYDMNSAAVVIDMHGHTGRAVGVFIPEPEGIARTILTGGRDDTPLDPNNSAPQNNLRVFDIATGRTIQQLSGHTGLVVAVDVSPDGKLAVSGSQDQTVRVWDIAAGTGQIVGQYEGSRGQVNGVAFLPDGQSVIAINRLGQVSQWRADGGGLIREFVDAADTNPAPLQALAISPDGTMVLTGGDSSILRLWDIASGALVRTFTIADRAVRAVAFSRSGAQIAVGSVNGSVTLFTIDGTLERTLAGHSRSVLSAAFADEQTLLTTGFDGTMRVWDIQSGFEVRRFDTADEPTISLGAGTLSSDAQTVLTGLSDGRMRLWRLYPTLTSLLAWTKANREVSGLADCAIRAQFSLTPCDENGTMPPFEWPALPTLNPPPKSVIDLKVGIAAVINTTDGDRQFIRPGPGVMDASQSTLVPDGTVVTLLDGPQPAQGYWWWNVQTTDGIVGWVAEFVPDENVQVLVPVGALD